MDAKRFARISVARRGTLLALLLAAATGSAEVPDGFAPVVDGGPVRTIAIQSDGAIVFGGGFSTVDGEPRNGLARVRTDGALDESYAPLDGQPAKDVHEVAVQFDGRLLYTTTLGANVLRLHPDGSADATWIGRECVGPQFALQADGKVVAPDACSGPDDPPLAMERLLPDGTLDTGFAAPTRTPGSKVTAIFARADGKIIFVGDFQKIGNANRPDIMRLMPSGQADPSPIYADFNGDVNTLLGTASGTVWVGGGFTQVDEGPYPGLVLLNTTGYSSGSIEGTPPAVDGTVYALAWDAVGILIAGDFTSVDGVPRHNLARVFWDGTLDTTFDPDVVGAVLAIAVQTDNKIVIGGYVSSVGGVGRQGIARIGSDGNVDDWFGDGTDAPVHALAAAANGSLAMGGEFAHIKTKNGTPIATPASLAWVGSNGDQPLPGFAPPEQCASPLCIVVALALQPDDDKLVVGSQYYVIGRPSGIKAADSTDPIPLMRLFPSGGVDPPFDANTVNWTGPTGFVNALVRLPDGKFLVGGDCMLGTRAVLARINADGTVDGTFSPLQDTGGNCAAYAIAVLPDGKIAVGGDFTYLANPIPDAPNLALLDASGHPYTPVYAEGGTVFALAAQPDGNVLIGGAFTDVNGAAPARLARMSGNGVVDESFNPDPNATVRAIGLRADGKAFVGGDFTAIGADASQHLALLDGSGAVDPVFSLDVDDSVYAIAVQPDGRVAFGGAFTHADAFPHNFVARASVIDPALFELKPRFVAGGLRTIIWKQQGAGPVPASPPRLSLSLDGIAYTAIGPMTYDAGAQQWSYDDFAPPLDQLMFLRVDVQTAGGGSIETVLPTFDADRIFADGFDP